MLTPASHSTSAVSLVKSDSKLSAFPITSSGAAELVSPTAILANRKRELFMKVLKDEFLRELSYLWEVASGRAKARDTILDKIAQPLMFVAGMILPVPWVCAAVGMLSATGEVVMSRRREERITVMLSLKTELNMPQLNILIDVVAREALRRYECFIVDRLSDNPEVGVVPFAKTGAQRMLEYVVHHGVMNSKTGDVVKLTLNESLLLAGLIEGQSGAWIEDFSNHQLQLKQTKTDFLGKSQPEVVDAEDVYARAGLRHLEIQEGKLIDNLYVRAKPRHHELPEWQKFQATLKGRIKPLSDFGYVRFRKQHGDHFSQDPEVGYVLMPLDVIRGRYDFAPQDLKTLSPGLLAELKASSHSMIRVNRGTIAEFVAWEKTAKGSSLVDYVQNVLHYPLIQQVICSDDLSGLSLAGFNLSHSDLSGAILSGDLTGTNLSHSYLVGTVFRNIVSAKKVILCGSHCEYLQAEGVNFQGSDLSQVRFTYAQLKGVNLIDCKTVGAKWAHADLSDIRSDVNVLETQVQQTAALQKEMLEQRQDLQFLTSLLHNQLGLLQKTTQTLTRQLEKQINPQLQGLSAQIGGLWRQVGDRLTFEAHCQTELQQLRAKLESTHETGANAVKELQAQLEITQHQLKHLQSSGGLDSAFKDFQIDFQQQLAGLDSELRGSLTNSEQHLQRDLQTTMAQQKKRLAYLETETLALHQAFDKRLTALGQRVDSLEQWIKTAETAMAEQRTEKEATKQLVMLLQMAMQALQKDLQQEKESRLGQEQKLVKLCQKLETATDAQEVRQLQSALQAAVPAPLPIGGRRQPPPSLLEALQAKLRDVFRQKEVVERAAINTSVRQKLQGKMAQIKQEQQRWEGLLENLNTHWVMHASAQESALVHLQKVFSETNAACEQRIFQLEADVRQLKTWSEVTQVQLGDLEREAGEARTQLQALQVEVARWTGRQQRYQLELDALRQPTILADEKGSGKQARLAKLQQLQSQLQSAHADEVTQRIGVVKTLYLDQQVALAALAAEDEELGITLAADQHEVAEKLKTLTAIETAFTQKQERVLKKFRSEVKTAIASLKKRVDKHENQQKIKSLSEPDLGEQSADNLRRSSFSSRLFDKQGKAEGEYSIASEPSSVRKYSK